MGSNKTTIALLTTLAATAAIGVYIWSKRKSRKPHSPPQQASPLSAIFARETTPKQASSVSLAIPPTSSPPSPTGTVEEIKIILSDLSKSDHPSSSQLENLKHLISNLSESERIELQIEMDKISFSLSEWYFYNTLRRNKHLKWNHVTGVVDEVLTPSQRIAGEKLATTMRKAYWDSHLEDLNNRFPPEYSRIIDRLVELDNRIRSYPTKSPPAASIDVELLKQEISNNAFDKHTFVEIIAGLVDRMYELESAAAHEETISWLTTLRSSLETSNTRENFHMQIVSVLSFLFSQLDLLDSEISNFKTENFPISKRIEKERLIFESLIQNCMDGAPRVRIPNIRRLLSPSGSAGQTIESLNQSLVEGIRTNLMDTITGRCARDDLLESFVVEKEQIGIYRATVQRCIDIACTLVAIQALVPTAGGKDVWNAVVDALCDAPDEGVELVNRFTDIIIASFQGNREKISHAIGQCVSGKVRALFERRISEILRQHNTAELPSNVLGSNPWYLSVLVVKFSKLCNHISTFLGDHIVVYLPVYRQLYTDPVGVEGEGVGLKDDSLLDELD